MKAICVLFLCFILIDCQNKSGEKKSEDSFLKESVGEKDENDLLFDIELDKVIEDAEEAQIPLSTFFKEIEYIPLETTSKSLIGNGALGIQQYVVTDKVIMADMKIFSREDGHYIGNLLKKGHGPQDYLYVIGIDADDKQEEFYLYDASLFRVHVVGYDNTYKGAINGCGDYANVYSFGNGNILIPNYCSLHQRYDAFFIDNLNTKDIVYKRISPALQGISNFEDCKRIGKVKSFIDIIGYIQNSFWKYQDEIRYYDTLTDTVYTIDKKYQIKSIGRLDTEKLRMRLDQWKVGAMSQNFYAYNLKKIFESQHYILIYLNKSNIVLKDKKDYWIIVSKKDKRVKAFKNKKAATEYSFYNDLDQGIPLELNFPTSKADGVCQFLSAEKIKDYIAEKGPSYFTTEKGKAFKAMGDRLKYDDNEVVAIMKWK